MHKRNLEILRKMLVSMDSLPQTARVWIYPSNRLLTGEEEAQITADLTAYLSNWASHGTLVRSAFELRYHQFIVIAADDNQHIGGCSLDELALGAEV